MRRIAVIAALVAAAFAQAPDFSKIEEKVTKVAGNIYMIEGINGFGGGNIGVSTGADGTVIIDDQFAPLAPKIEAALKGITDKPVKFVISTHWHGDHTHGNIHFGKTSVLIAQDNVRKRLETTDEFEGRKGTPAPAIALPVITFGHDVTVHLNGEQVKGIHAPQAHTDGDTIVWFTKSNVVHMGDNFFNTMFPFIDLESGGTIKGYIASVENVLGQVKEDTKIIPGHGPLAAKADLQKFLTMLKEATAVIDAGLKAGKSVKQMQDENVLAKWEDWGKGFVSTKTMVAQLAAALKGETKNPPWE
jgi:cyclase